MKAIWNGSILAESDQTIVAEGNHYFPPSAVRSEYFKDSGTYTTCPGKAWPAVTTWSWTARPMPARPGTIPRQRMLQSKGHVAFWRGVKVEK